MERRRGRGRRGRVDWRNMLKRRGIELMELDLSRREDRIDNKHNKR